MTPADICRNALIQGAILSLSDTIYADDILKAFDQLNSMLNQWNRQRFNLFSMLDISCVSDGGISYTVGPTGDFSTPRPDKIMAAYARLLPIPPNGQPNDTPLRTIEAYEDYAEITTKELTGFPVAVFLDTQYPTANLFVWPLPLAGQFEIHIVVKNQITTFSDLTTDISMPPEMVDAMVWNLALRLRPNYKLPLDQTVQNMALQSIAVVNGANAQVAILNMPMGFGSRRGGNNAWWYYTGGMI